MKQSVASPPSVVQYDYRATAFVPLGPLRANFERTKMRAARLSPARIIFAGSNPLAPNLDRGGFPACAS